MKVGIFSDSHQNLDNLEEVTRWLVEEEKVDVLIHLGDDYQDTKVLEKFVDLKIEELIAKKEVDMALVGHAHIPKIEDQEGVLVLNPGHLKSEDKKGYSLSLGLIDFERKAAKVITLEKKVTFIQKNF